MCVVIHFLSLDRFQKASKEDVGDFLLVSLYGMVKTMVKENISLSKQRYFAIIYFLFTTLL